MEPNAVHYKPGGANQLTMLNTKRFIVGKDFKKAEKKPGLSKCAC